MNYRRGLAQSSALFYVVICLVLLLASLSPSWAAGLLAHPDHIVIIVEENHSLAEILGSSQAPYINSLVSQGARITGYQAVAHPSEPNYFALFSGSTQGITDDNDYTITASSIAGHLRSAGKTFTGYAESGSPRKHNPWESFTDAAGTGKDFSLFPTDFTQLPTVSFVSPNLNNDMHDGTILQGDQWLQTHLDAYVQWAKTHNSEVIVVFDEDDSSQSNLVMAVVVSAGLTAGSTLTAPADHIAMFHTMETQALSAGESADGTIVTTVGPQITNASGTTFSISSGAQVVINGVVDTGTGGVIELAYVNHVLWHENTALNWYSYNGTPGSYGGPSPSPLGGGGPGGVVTGQWLTGQIARSDISGGQFHFSYLVSRAYTATGTKIPLYIHEHTDTAGNGCYQGGGCDYLPTAWEDISSSTPDIWYNNTAWQTAYPAIVVLPYAEQLCPQGSGVCNFGGWGDSPGTSPNENAVVAMAQYFINNFNVDPNRIYITGDSLGGIGSWAACLDYGAKNGTSGRVFAACLPFAGVIERGGLTNAQTNQVINGSPVWAVSGQFDTTSLVGDWNQPLWRAITGNSNYPSTPGAQAGTSPYRYGEVPGGDHSSAWDNYRALPNAKPLYDWLFSQNAGIVQPTGNFSVANGLIISPTGKNFLGIGINVGDFDMPNVSKTATAQPLTTLFPGITLVRLAIYDGGSSTNPSAYSAPSKYASFISQLTSQGIVVEVEHHTLTDGSDAGGGAGYVPKPGDPWLTAETNFYAAMAAAYKNNPYVWFGTTNEPPQGDEANLSIWHQTTYNAIRGAGNNNIILIQPPGGGNPGVTGPTGGLTMSVYRTMTNVAIDLHFYGWEVGFSRDQNFVNATLQGSVAGNSGILGAAAIQNANGNMPVVLAEYGPDSTGSDLVTGALVVNAVLGSGRGSAAWHWGVLDPVVGGDNLTDNAGTTLTPYGQQVAAAIAAAGPLQTESLSINTISTVPVSTAFSVSGSIVNASTAPVLQYQNNAGTWLNLPSGSSVSSVAFSFTDPGITTAGATNTVRVRDANATTITATSNSFAVASTFTPSPNNTVVTTVGPTIVDSVGNTFSITSGGQISITPWGGTPAVEAGTSGVIELAYVNNVLWQENSAGNWYNYLGTPGSYGGPVTTSPVTSESISVNTIAAQVANVAFTVTGTVSNVSVTPTLQYNDNGGAWTALPAGFTVTLSGGNATFSFLNPGLAANPTATVNVRDANNTSITGASNGFAVTAGSGETITITTVPAQTANVAFTIAGTISGLPGGGGASTDWSVNPGGDGTFWKQPFQSSANWISSGPLVTALRGGSPSVNTTGNFTAPWYVGKATDPVVRVTDGSRSENIHIPLGAVAEGPASSVDQSIGGSDQARPYLVWAISGASMTNASGNPISAVQASGTVITGTYGFGLSDGAGQLLMDAVTGQPGSDNAIGNIQDYELSQITANPNYVIQHMLTFELDPSFQASQGGPIWPLKVIDTSPSPGSYLGPIPQGITIGIPANVPRPTGQTRGFYALWDQAQQFGLFNYNFGGTGGVNISINSFSGAYNTLISQMVTAWPAIAANFSILNYNNGVAGAQYSVATIKGAVNGSTNAFPAAPPLSLAPTGGVNVAPSTFGAWYPSGYNVTPNNPGAGAATPPTLQYQDGTGAWQAFPNGSSVTTTTFSFVHPGMAIAPVNTVNVRDAAHPTVVGTATFAVISAPTGGTTWNPSDTSTSITLSSGNQIATSTAATQGGTRSITSQSSGKFCFQVGASTITANLTVGLSNSGYALAGTAALGANSNGIGFYPALPGALQSALFNGIEVLHPQLSQLTPTSGGTMYDGSNNAWTMQSNGFMYENGTQIAPSAGTSAMTIVSNVVYGQDSTTGVWYIWDPATQNFSTAPAPPVFPVASTADISGDAVMICADLTAQKEWISTPAMRLASGVLWNSAVIGSQNPATGTGGVSFSGLVCPCFVTADTRDVATKVIINTSGPFAVTTPVGFTAWQSTPTILHHPFLFNYGLNDHANDNTDIVPVRFERLVR